MIFVETNNINDEETIFDKKTPSTPYPTLTIKKILKNIVSATFSKLIRIYAAALFSVLKIIKGRFQIESKNRMIDKYVIHSGLSTPKANRANSSFNKYKRMKKQNLLIFE